MEDPYNIKTLDQFKQLASDFLKQLELVTRHESIHGMAKIVGIAYIHVPIVSPELDIARSLYMFCMKKALDKEIELLIN